MKISAIRASHVTSSPLAYQFTAAKGLQWNGLETPSNVAVDPKFMYPKGHGANFRHPKPFPVISDRIWCEYNEPNPN